MKNNAPDYGTVRIFVYGTLKKEGPNNIVLKKAGAKFLGYDEINVTGAMFMDLDAFPAMIFPMQDSDHTVQTIRGEIWYGPTEILHSCDILEGHPLFFRRTKHWTRIHQKRAWVYSLPEDWIAEGRDFLEEKCWAPADAEQRFWDTFDKRHVA